MKYSREKMDKRQRTYVRMIGDLRNQLNQALTEEFEKRGLTQAEMGRLIGRDKSFVSKKMNGVGNMTLETLADLAYALNRPVRFVLPDREKMGGHNKRNASIISTPEISSSYEAETWNKIKSSTLGGRVAIMEVF